MILHNLCGLSLGYGVGKLLGFSHKKRSAISIEVGMQNSGLASSLAALHFAAYPLPPFREPFSMAQHLRSHHGPYICQTRMYKREPAKEFLTKINIIDKSQ